MRSRSLFSRLYLSLSVLLSIPVAAGALPLANPTVASVGERDALEAATRDLCHRDVVLLGENGFHGDGRTPAFKAALIQRLVTRCHFNAVFFEASHYDFLQFAHLLRVGQPVSRDMVSAAIGGKWNQSDEVAPLITFLFAQARSGRVTLGGLDDQLGSRGAFYANEGMPSELTNFLDEGQRNTCQALMVRRITHGSLGAMPGSEPDYARLRQCLASIRTAVMSGGDRLRRDELLDMVENIERDIARDSHPMSQLILERGHSMFLNLDWMARRLRSRPRIIVWAANAHIAKETSLNPAFGGGRDFGSYVHEAYGNRAFALGFTAASGSFRWDRNETRRIPPAPPESLEARALAGHDRDTAYLGPAQLARLGEVVGAAADDHRYVSARWANIYDGIVVFRAERPPTRHE